MRPINPDISVHAYGVGDPEGLIGSVTVNLRIRTVGHLSSIQLYLNAEEAADLATRFAAAAAKAAAPERSGFAPCLRRAEEAGQVCSWADPECDPQCLGCADYQDAANRWDQAIEEQEEHR